MSASPNGRVPSDVRAAAAFYLGLGYLPVPVPRTGRRKAPALDGWPDLRPTPEDLDRLFPPGQDLNVGLLAGAPSGGLIDIDLDAAEALAAGRRLLPPTGWVSGRQGKPGSHWWYVVGDPPDKAQEPYRDLDGTMLVEVHSSRWQVVAPPSVHESGEGVLWHAFTQPAQVDLAELLTAVRSVAAVTLLARHWPGQGARQDSFLAMVGGLLRAGWAKGRAERFVEALAGATRDDEARKRVQTVAQTARKLEQADKTTGWPRLEALLGPAGKGVLQRVRQWLGLTLTETTPAGATPAAKKVRVLEPYRPFPVEALPEPLGEYVRQGGAALGCDPAYLALPALAVAAGLIGYTRVLHLKRTWRESAVLWSLIVGESGTLKSPAYRLATDYLFPLQRRLRRQFQEDYARFLEEKEAYQDAKRRAKEGGTDPGDPPEEPVERIVFSTDATIEALAEIIEDNPRGLLVTCDELTAWFSMFARYHTGKQGCSDLPRWLSMHSAGGFSYHRKTGDRRRIVVPHAAVSVTGGIQPGVLARALTPEFLDAGLAARLLMAMPPKRPKRWSEAEIDPEVERAYQGTLDRLLTLDFDTVQGEKEPRVLRFSPEAKAVWVTFYDSWAREQAAVEGELAAAYSKLEAYAARFALLHHVVQHARAGADDRDPVGTRSVEAGITLARWFAGEARRIYATLSESNEDREARRLVEFLQARGGRMTVRGLMRANCRRFPDAESAESALAALVEAGLARWVESQTGMRGGKPIKAVELCMTHDTDDTDPGGGDEDGGPGYDTGRDSGPEGPGGGASAGRPPVSASAEDGRTNGDSVGISGGGGVIGVMRHAGGTNGPPSGAAAGDRAHPGGAVSGAAVMPPACTVDRCGETDRPALLVQSPADLQVVAAAVAKAALIAVDVETTGLNPRTDRVRLLSLSAPGEAGPPTYLVDCFAVDPAPLWEALAGKDLVLHNAAFDLAFLARLGFTPAAPVHDTMLLAQLVVAGTDERVSLEACCQRWLGQQIDKAAQKSDWSGTLTPEQLAYAARDAEVLVPLLRALEAEAQGAGLGETAALEGRCLPAVVWLARAGTPLDRDAWRDLARSAREEADRLRQELDGVAPPRPGAALFAGPWNWDSPQQARQALALAGCPVDDTTDSTLARLDHPLAELLRRYRTAARRRSAYGQCWLKHVAADGRVYAAWRQLGAVTGRMSCSAPNLQQLPRGDCRRCVAAPPGRALVKADWSQLHLRIIAGVAPEPAMQEAFRRGLDLHTETAHRLTGKPEVSKEERQRAKAAAFGLCYGMGAERFRAYARSEYGLELTEAEAGALRREFFRAYPGLRSWHRCQPDGEVCVTAPSGRRCQGVRKFSDKLAYRILLVEADCLKAALGLLWERRAGAPGAFPVLACHDELVVECDLGQVEAVEGWLVGIMLEAAAPHLAPVPVEVSASIGTTWGGGEVRAEQTHRSEG